MRIRFTITRTQYIEAEADVDEATLLPSRNTLNAQPVYDAVASGSYDVISTSTDQHIEGESITWDDA